KKIYFRRESHLLRRYQTRFNKEVKLACLSETDQRSLEKRYGYHHAFFLPCFLPWQQLKSREGKGDYLLYHGNLTIAENEKAARWLIENLADHLPQTLVIAGKGISKKLQATAARYSTVRLINHPPEDELNALIRDAHIHLLPSFNQTGVKLKLLNAVLNGRFCITNEEGVKGSGISECLHIKNTADEWIATINELWPRPFSPVDMEKRKSVLDVYNNNRNAHLLSERW
ncbi:MAG TPA: glycosyltransferase family 4 protein, partial [Flavisolibacter sp.]|nr:glycosyltransferase family 4 protein [Flavisolibacter sp.]